MDRAAARPRLSHSAGAAAGAVCGVSSPLACKLAAAVLHQHFFLIIKLITSKLWEMLLNRKIKIICHLTPQKELVFVFCCISFQCFVETQTHV